jgi:methionine--tRNA ligase beta chain
MIEFAQWQELDLRVGKVVAAEPHPNAAKLIVLAVDLGSETRQIVAGLKEWYDPAAMVGRSIVVVANLKPAMLRGVESQGMLLAATDETGGSRIVSALTCDRDVAPGSKVS